MMKDRALTALLLAAVLTAACGCGEEEPPAPATPPARPETAPATRPAPAPETEPASLPDAAPATATTATTLAIASTAAFERDLDRVLALQADARFSDALDLVRDLQSSYRRGEPSRRLRELDYRLKEQRREAMGLPFAVRQLAAESPAAVQVAVDKLLDAGDVGRIFLRKAVREGEPPVAGKAADVLADARDPQTAEAILSRLESDSPEELSAALGEAAAHAAGLFEGAEIDRFAALAQRPDAVGAAAARALSARLKWRVAERLKAEAEAEAAAKAEGADEAAGKENEGAAPDGAIATTQATRPVAATQPTQPARDVIAEALVDVLTDAEHPGRVVAAEGLLVLLGDGLDRDRVAFNEKVGSPDAFAGLRRFVAGRLDADAPAASEWALRHGRPVEVVLAGLWGDYRDHEFKNHYFHRVDERLHWENHQFGYPGNRTDYLGVRWSGRLLVPETGEYTFSFTVEDKVSLAIDGETVSPEGKEPVEVRLTEGAHAIALEYVEINGNEYLTVKWRGEDLRDQVLGGEHLRTRNRPLIHALKLETAAGEEAAGHVEALKQLVDALDADVLGELLTLTKDEGGEPSRNAADVLVAFFRSRAKSDPAAFDKAADAEGAFAALQEFVATRLTAGEPAAAGWARARAHAVGLIAIDGVLDDPAWGAASATPFAGNAQAQPPRPTLRIARDDETIYFGFHRDAVQKEGKPVPFKADKTGSDDARAWEDDDFEVFLTDAEQDVGLQFGVSVAGGRFEGRANLADKGFTDLEWDGAWRAAARAEENRMFVEIAVPVSTLAAAGIDADTLAVNAVSHAAADTENANAFLVDPGPVGFGQCQGFLVVEWQAPDAKQAQPGRNYRYVQSLKALPPPAGTEDESQDKSEGEKGE